MPGRVFKAACAAAIALAACAVMASAVQARAVHEMKIDASGLTSTAFFMDNRWFEGDTVETVELAAGNHFLAPGSGLVMSCQLTVTDAGTWAYASECDGFLAGRGTDTLRLIGYTVTVDASRLSTPIYLANLTVDLFGASPRPVTLLPTYADMYPATGPGVISACSFRIALDGTIAYSDEVHGCLTGRGTRTVTFHGVPFNVDARELTTASFTVLMANSLDHLPSNVVQRLRMLPTVSGYQYGGWTVSGILWPSLGVEIGLDGKLTYPASADGWVSGRGTDTLVIHGYPVEIDARALPPNSFHIPDGNAFNLGGAVHSLRLAPVSYLYFTGDPAVDFRFSIRESDGAVEVPGEAACGRGQAATLIIGCRTVSIEDLVTDEPPLGTTARRTVRVLMSEPAPVDVTVDYATADGSATAPGDYEARSGTLTIPAGRTGAPILLTVNGDGAAEDPEQLTISLSNPRGATIGRASATVTINDAVVPDTVITSGPGHGATVTTPPTFAFEAVTRASSYLECNVTWLGEAATGFRRCTSPMTVVPRVPSEPSRLRFEVRAVDFRGNVDPTPAVRVITYRPSRLDLSVVGMEITQGVQRRDCESGVGCALGIMVPDAGARANGRNPAVRYQGLTLAGQCQDRDAKQQPCPPAKNVIARVYVSYNGDPALARGAMVRVFGYDSNGRVLGSQMHSWMPRDPAAPAIPPRLRPCCAALTYNDRRNPQAAYTFSLPGEWSRHRSLRLRAVVSPARPDIFDTVPVNDQLEVFGIPFERPTTIVVMPVKLKVRGASPADGSEYRAFEGAVAAFPTAFDIKQYRGELDATAAFNEPIASDEQREVLDLVDAWAGGSPRNFGSGVYPFGLYAENLGLITAATSPGTDLYQDRPASYAQATGRALTAVAHELGHGLQLPHAGRQCGSASNGQAGSAWPPDDEGRTASFGLDTRAAWPYRIVGDTAPPVGYPYNPAFGTNSPAQWDLMSYCPPGFGDREEIHWLSIRNWDHLRRYFAPGDALPARAGARAASHAVAAQRSVPALGVTAFIDDGAVSIRRLTRVTMAATPSLPDSPWHVVVRDAAGKVLSDTGVAETAIMHSSAPMLRAKVPAAGAASVQIVKDGAVVAERARSAHSPRAAIVSPRRGARVRGRHTTVRWRATDEDGDELTVYLDYSADGGRSWSTVFIGPDRGQTTLSTSLLTGSRNARLRVRAHDGFEETAATSGRFVSAGARPAVRILTPSSGLRISADATLVAQGEAHDDAGDRVAGRRLTWRLGGRIVGRGQEIAATELPAGRRRLQLSARDSRGRVGTASVRVRVLPVAPRFVELKAPRAIKPKARRLRVRVVANVAATLRIGGRSYRVSSRARTIGVRVRPGRQPVRLRAVLTAGGRRSSATLVVARRR